MVSPKLASRIKKVLIVILLLVMALVLAIFICPEFTDSEGLREIRSILKDAIDRLIFVSPIM